MGKKMKKVKLIYNPFAGDTTFKHHLDEIVSILQITGKMEVHLFRVTEYGDIEKHIESMDKNLYSAILVSGGDGTINLVVNAMEKNNIKVPLGIFPSGTANDFATYVGIPKNPVEAAKVIANGLKGKVDIGKVGDDYFINVVCIGLFAKISQSVAPELKNSIGKLAYYIKGAEVLTNAKPMSVKITTSKKTYTEEAYLILIMNSSGAGGFNKLAPYSSLNDGKFDLVVFKSSKRLTASARPFLQSLTGAHIEDENVIYTQDNYFKIESLEESFKNSESDIDGEKGPDLPLEIKVLEKALEIFVPEKTSKNIKKNKFLHSDEY